MITPDKYVTVVNLIFNEFKLAKEKFPDFHSYHEGYAVIQEELDELWYEIKNKPPLNNDLIKKEAIQLAAMALRFITDLFNGE